MPDTSSSSSAPHHACPNCGAPLPDHAPQGLCPRCLFAGVAGATETGAASADPRTAPQTPEELAPHFPQLEILSCLGRGGMGVVYKARQKTLDRLVALKLLAPERAGDPAFARRFTNEARALAALSHPNIVTIHDFGLAAGSYFLLMEFVDGVNMRQALHTGGFTPEQALAIVPPICGALQYAHEHGIVHRDIKPENLLLDKEGHVKIADFGIAKILGVDPAPTTEAEPAPASSSEGATFASLAGTPQYMAPEQIEHQVTDHRADIYSLGVVLYEMLTGERPNGALEPPSRRVRVDVRIDEIVLRALERTPDLRYQTAGEFGTQLATVAFTSSTSETHAPTRASSSPAQPKRSRSSIATPEHMAGFWGKYVYICSGKGWLVLAENRLTYSEYEAVTEIPLESIRELGIGRYSLWAKPTGLDFIRVTYLTNGAQRTLCFTPHDSGLRLTPDTNQIVAEWFDAIRDAVFHRTGREPIITAPPRGRKPFTAESITKVVFAGALLAPIALLLPILGLGALRAHLLLASGVVALSLLFAYLLTTGMRRALRRWSDAPAGSPAPRPFAWFLGIAGAFLTLYGGYGLLYTENLVRQGAGLWVPEAISSALAHLPELTFCLVAGTVLLWILSLRQSSSTSRFERITRLIGLKIVPLLTLLLLLRTFVIQPFGVATNGAAPEIPRGSEILVWKLSKSFAPGDLIAYSQTGETLVGRIVGQSDSLIEVNRNGQPNFPVQRLCIEGKIVCILWRGSSSQTSPANNAPALPENTAH